ncbi:MAG TPA: hypothetical protein VIL86_11640 [Tepidisphaeraceae bacterium]|jgi:hypothetical protein
MKRRVLTFLSIVSLVLCMAFIAGWVRSHFTTDLFVMVRHPGDPSLADGTYYELVTIPGQFRITVASKWVGDLPTRWCSGTIPTMTVILGQRPVYRGWLAFGVATEGRTEIVRGYDQRTGQIWKMFVPTRLVAVPYAVGVFATALLPAWMLLPTLRRRRQHRQWLAEGRCLGCGYDLRASSDRCSECGLKIETKRGFTAEPQSTQRMQFTNVKHEP